MEKLTNIIEAILFASGDEVPIDLLREKLDISERKMDTILQLLEKKYSGECGIRLLHFNHKLQFATNPEYKEPVSSVLAPIREREFTRTILECAAIIAYQQPITRTELENLRGGVNSDYAITTLMSLDMIEAVGRKDSPGKPVLYGTTDKFLKRFKLKTLKELPDYQDLMDRIAEITAIKDTGNYLYEKDVYDPENDIETTQEDGENGETATGEEQPKDSFELPDFLKDIEDGIIKIQ